VRPGRVRGQSFNSYSQGKAELDAKLPEDMPQWQLHDLRRTARSHVLASHHTSRTPFSRCAVFSLSTPSLSCSRSDVLSRPATLASDQTVAKSAAPLIGQLDFLPNGPRPSLQKIFAVRICREGELDRAVVDNFTSYQSDELLDIPSQC
jgi:hypothetical protein